MRNSPPFCVWITGLAAAGKTTLAAALRQELARGGVASYVLDGDEVRKRLSRDLGFGQADRSENVRRVAEVARMMVDAGVIVIVSLISPFARDRRAARDLFEHGCFIEVFIDTPLAVCEERDPKGLYRRARAGELSDFTGISSAYEAPEAAEVHLVHDGAVAEAHAARVVAHLTERGLLA